ncbi:MAG: aminotransferase class IV [Planctomycetia bacterium]|nr:aminotransferase class IV [Planctomycetia bacterium]
MSQRVVYFNGRIVPESEAKVSIFDSALQLGDMAFEVTRTYRGEPYRLSDHLRRLWNSMTALGIEPGLSPDALERITLDLLAQNRATETADVDWNIIHDVSRGPASAFRSAFAPADRRPTVVVACFPLAEKMAALAPAYETGVELVVPAQRSLPRELFDPAVKCRSRAHYQLANLQAEALRPGSTAVLLDPDGFITEGTSGNVFFVQAGKLSTPTARNILPGITRGVVLGLAARLGIEANEADITPAEALAADEVFVTSTSIGVLHARSFAGRTIGTGRIGPTTLRLRDALTTEVGLDFAAQARAYAAKYAPPART